MHPRNVVAEKEFNRVVKHNDLNDIKPFAHRFLKNYRGKSMAGGASVWNYIKQFFTKRLYNCPYLYIEGNNTVFEGSYKNFMSRRQSTPLGQFLEKNFFEKSQIRELFICTEKAKNYNVLYSMTDGDTQSWFIHDLRKGLEDQYSYMAETSKPYDSKTVWKGNRYNPKLIPRGDDAANIGVVKP